MSDDYQAKTQAFWQWLLSRGATVSPKIQAVDYRDRNQGRAIIATNDIAQDEIVFKIPQQLILSPSSSDLIKLIPSIASFGVWPSLILTMIYESTKPSWKPYFDILPQNFDTLIYWSPEELTELQGSAVLDKIGKEEVEGMYKSIVLPIIETNPAVFADTDTSFLAFQRMGSIIMSYSFDLEKNDALKEEEEDENEDEEDEEAHYFKAMVPLADMLNADVGLNNCRLHYEPPNQVEMIATKPIKQGEQLFNDYGPLPSSDLLRRYGYYSENHELYDVVEISGKLIIEVFAGNMDKSDLDERVEYLLDKGVLEDSIDIESSGAIPDELKIILQILSVPRTTFESLKEGEKMPKHKKDATARRFIEEIVRRRTAMYPTTTADDVNLLVAGGLVNRQKMAVRVRVSEKKILANMKFAVSEWEEEERKRKTEGGDTGMVDDTKRSRKG